MRHFSRNILLVALALSFVLPFSLLAKTTPLTTSEVSEVIENGVSWMKNAQEKTGHFRYEYAPYEDRYLDDDNIVRQAGSLLILGEIATRDSENTYDLEDTIRRSVRYFKELSEKDTHGGKTFRCIRSSEKSETCKLGATSLALVGILDLVERYPDQEERYKPLIEDYIDFILAMQKDNGGFRTTFSTAKTEQSDTESSYATGEAFLALVRYYQYRPVRDVREALDDTFVYIRSSSVPFDTALYLWAMAALKDMDRLWPNNDYFAYAKSYTDWRMAPFASRRNTDHNMCAYIEGVVSAYPILAPRLSPVERARYREEIDFWLRKEQGLQVTEGDRVRITGDLEAPPIKIENMEQALGGFLTGENELTQRIDFTQHCVSAYLQTLVDIDGSPLTAF